MNRVISRLAPVSLEDDDSVVNGLNAPLGDEGDGNGNFQGQAYTLVVPGNPQVLSINRTTPSGTDASARTATSMARKKTERA